MVTKCHYAIYLICMLKSPCLVDSWIATLFERDGQPAGSESSKVILQLGNYSVNTQSKNKLSAADCGKFREDYIVGGHKAADGAHPWMAAIILKSGQFCCSASIINEYWVITAAHVFEDFGIKADYYSIRVGSNDRTLGTDYQIERVIPHEAYNLKNYKEWDIALMKVKGPIQMSASVRPICLPDQSYASPEGSVTVTGWGNTAFNVYSSPRALMQVELQILAPNQCAQRYSQVNYNIYKSQFCTWNENKDACQGDSGGPAVQIKNGKAMIYHLFNLINSKPGRGELVGIVSYGVRCADQYPGVFTKVSYFINWIQTKLATK